MIPHDVIEYIYSFLQPKPCRIPFLILAKEMYNRYNHRTRNCYITHVYGFEYCIKHRFIRPVQRAIWNGPGCIIS